MQAATKTSGRGPAAPGTTAEAAWQRRVASIGSQIQLGFAALWLVRASLATGWPGRLPMAAALAVMVVVIGVCGAIAVRGLAPRPRGAAAGRLGRAITVATAVQLAASCALPVVAGALGRPDLTVAAVAVTIGILLLWLRVTLATPGHLVAGLALIGVPIALALLLTGGTLTATSGFATAAILCGSALAGFHALASGALGSPPAGDRGPQRAGTLD
jgi:hypothetical protein